MRDESPSEPGEVRVISLSAAPGEKAAWDRPRIVIYLWAVCELLFVTNAWQISSKVRVAVLRAFGAEIDEGVVFRPRTRVKFPWKLHIGKDSWVGEGVWFHNQDHVYIGHDVVISQETFLTTGSHSYREDMALVTRPIHISDGVWISSRCLVLGGACVGRSAFATPMTILRKTIAPNSIVSGTECICTGSRFPDPPTSQGVD